MERGGEDSQERRAPWEGLRARASPEDLGAGMAGGGTRQEASKEGAEDTILGDGNPSLIWGPRH